MKLFVVREIEQLILLSNANAHAQYYGILSLSQMILSKKEVDVANKLIDIYFAMFRKLLGINASKKEDKTKNKKDGKGKAAGSKGKKTNISKNSENLYVEEESLNSKILAAVLTGVNRAFPFANIDDKV